MDAAIVKLDYVAVPPALILALIRAWHVDVDAVLAGGALRDMILGREVKDLDIFVGPRPGEGGVPSDGWVRPDYLTHLNLAYQVEGRLTVHPNIATYLGMVDVEACYEHVVPGIGVINTIVLRERMTLAEKLSRLDFGLCQVGFDGVDVWATPAALKDMEQHTFTLVRCDSKRDYERSMVRYQRLVQKYPGWQLIVPDEYCRAYQEPVIVTPMGRLKDMAARQVFGRSLSDAQDDRTCVACGKPATEFRDALSRKEYGISGFCQSCQDGVFGA